MPFPLLAVGFWGTAGAWLTRIFMSRGGQMVAGTMAALGVSMAVQEFAVEPMLDKIIAASGGLSGDALAWMAYLGFDDFMTTVLGAYAYIAGMGWMRLKMNPLVGGGTGY